MKQWLTLSRLELINLFGINVYRHEKDPSKKKNRTFLLGAYVFVALALMGYFCSSAYGFIMLGVGDKIPTYFPILASIFALFWSIFTSRSALYREKDLVLLASLPVKSLPIVSARLLKSYLESMMVCTGVLLPSFTLYVIFMKPDVLFYVGLPFAFLFLPILPTAIAAWVGILFTSIISRMRHKVLAETMLAILLVIGSMLLPYALTGNGNLASLPGVNMTGAPSDGGASSEEVMKLLSAQISQTFDQFEGNYPLLKVWGTFFNGTHGLGLLCYGLLSFLILALTALVIGKNFFTLSAKLHATSVHHDYQISAMESHSALTALLQKEARRYFSCGIYVSNTIIGPVLAVAFALILGFYDVTALLSTVENVPEGFNLQAGLPFFLGLFFSITSISASSVSMEGNTWWILKSLPVSFCDVVNSKLLFNLIFMAPFYGLSEILLLFTVQANLLERLCLILAPAASILFSVTWGLFVNLKFPKFSWSSAAEVVKQSAATGLSLLSMFTSLIPALAMILLPEAMGTGIAFIMIGILCGTACLLYRKCLKMTC